MSGLFFAKKPEFLVLLEQYQENTSFVTQIEIGYRAFEMEKL